MAITIMGGLFVATALTLLVVPALYAVWFRVREDERTDAFDAEPAPGFARSMGAMPIAAE
jgi:hypothetical protein